MEEEAEKPDPGDFLCCRRWLREIDFELDAEIFNSRDDDDDDSLIRIYDIKVRISNQLREEDTEVHHTPL